MGVISVAGTTVINASGQVPWEQLKNVPTFITDARKNTVTNCYGHKGGTLAVSTSLSSNVRYFNFGITAANCVCDCQCDCVCACDCTCG